MLACLESLRALVAAWYQTDRIRIAPSVGRLLALGAGDRFVFRCESYQVLSRIVHPTETGYELEFQLTSSLGEGSLVVVCDTNSQTTEGELRVSNQRVVVFDSDVVVLKN